jgi:hypothetical protein
MSYASPLTIFFAVIASVGLVGVSITHFRRRRIFDGYWELAADVNRVSASLGSAETFRDGSDLVVSGNYEGLPTVVRFSHGERTPSLVINCGAPIDFAFSMIPKGYAGSHGAKVLSTGRKRLDEHFLATSGDPEQARLFCFSPETLDHMERLCCSGKTFLVLSKGQMEVRELVIPDSAASHILAHLSSLHILSRRANTLPGAHSIKLQPIQRERSSWIFRFALAMGIVCVTAAMLSDNTSARSLHAVEPSDGNGISRHHATLISDPVSWRTVNPGDLGLEFTAWIQGFGLNPQATIQLDPLATDHQSGTAYLLATDKNPHVRRVVWIVGDRVLCDVVDSIDGIASVPKEQVSRILSEQNPSSNEQVDGDALLLVRDYSAMNSGTIFYVNAGQLHSFSPSNFHEVNLR